MLEDVLLVVVFEINKSVSSSCMRWASKEEKSWLVEFTVFLVATTKNTVTEKAAEGKNLKYLFNCWDNYWFWNVAKNYVERLHRIAKTILIVDGQESVSKYW